MTKDKILELLKQAKKEKKEAELLENKEAELLEKKDIKVAIRTLEEAKRLLEGEEGSRQTVRNDTSREDDEILYLYKYGNILYGVEEYRRALKYYEEIVERQPNENTYKALGDCLRKLNLYDKALEQYKTALEEEHEEHKINSSDKAAILNSRGLTYIAKAIDSNSYGSTLYTPKMDNKKALKDFEKAIEICRDDNLIPLYYCNKGIALYTLGRSKQMSDSFKEAEKFLLEKQKKENLVKEGHGKELTQQNINYIKNALPSFIELEREVKEIQTKFEDIQNKLKTKQLQQALQKDYNRLREDYNELLELVKSNVLKQEDINRLSEIGREELTEKMDQVTADLKQVKHSIKEVEKNIADIKQQLNAIYSELSMKLQDHGKVLEEYLSTLSLIETDKAKIKEYYKAFVGTIAATYITAQVVDSGKVELGKPLMLTLLSAGFPFIPLGGEVASKGAELASIPVSSLISCMSSIGEKVLDEAVSTGIHKTSKGNARKIKQLATDPSDLSKQVSDAAIKIVKNKDKQKQIINITLEYLNKQPGKALQKIQALFKKMGKKYDNVLHGEVYSTAAELLGKKDAKTLIKQYLKYMIDKKSPQDGFEEAFQAIMKDYVYE